MCQGALLCIINLMARLSRLKTESDAFPKYSKPVLAQHLLRQKSLSCHPSHALTMSDSLPTAMPNHAPPIMSSRTH